MNLKKILLIILLLFYLVLINIYYIVYLSFDLNKNNITFLSFLFFNYFDFLGSHIQHLFNAFFIIFFGILIYLKAHSITSYIKKLLKSFIIFGTIFQHYFWFTFISLFLTSIILRRSHYQEMYFFNADFIYVLLLFLIVFSFFPGRKTNKNIISEEYKDDEKPISDFNDDIIGFRPLINEIESYVLSRDNNSPASTIGIIGDWGSGKSSLFNLINKKFKIAKAENLKGYSKYELIYFNAAQYSDTNILFIHFYNLMLSVMDDKYILPQIDKFRILNSIAEIFGKGLKISLFINSIIPTSNVEKYLQKFSSWLGIMDLRLVVLLDDADRLQSNELDGVFKLLRLVTSNMRNITILMASEPKALNNYVKEFISTSNG